MEQEKKRTLKKLEDEKKMINYMIDTVNERTLYNNLNNLSLSESKLLYKCELMKLFRNKMKSGDNSIIMIYLIFIMIYQIDMMN